MGTKSGLDVATRCTDCAILAPKQMRNMKGQPVLRPRIQPVTDRLQVKPVEVELTLRLLHSYKYLTLEFLNSTFFYWQP
jgi:hypothetical protein